MSGPLQVVTIMRQRKDRYQFKRLMDCVRSWELQRESCFRTSEVRSFQSLELLKDTSVRRRSYADNVRGCQTICHHIVATLCPLQFLVRYLTRILSSAATTEGSEVCKFIAESRCNYVTPKCVTLAFPSLYRWRRITRPCPTFLNSPSFTFIHPRLVFCFAVQYICRLGRVSGEDVRITATTQRRIEKRRHVLRGAGEFQGARLDESRKEGCPQASPSLPLRFTASFVPCYGSSARLGSSLKASYRIGFERTDVECLITGLLAALAIATAIANRSSPRYSNTYPHQMRTSTRSHELMRRS